MTAAGKVRGVPGFGTPKASKLKGPSYAVSAFVVGVGSFGSMTWNWFLDLASRLAASGC